MAGGVPQETQHLVLKLLGAAGVVVAGAVVGLLWVVKVADEQGWLVSKLERAFPLRRARTGEGILRGRDNDALAGVQGLLRQRKGDAQSFASAVLFDRSKTPAHLQLPFVGGYCNHQPVPGLL